jgi:hypothetical protein
LSGLAPYTTSSSSSLSRTSLGSREFPKLLRTPFIACGKSCNP